MEFLLTALEVITQNMSVIHEKKKKRNSVSPLTYRTDCIWNFKLNFLLSVVQTHVGNCRLFRAKLPEGFPAQPCRLHPWAPGAGLSETESISAELDSASMNQENTEAVHTTITSWHVGASTWSDSRERIWEHSSSLHQHRLGLCLLWTTLPKLRWGGQSN